MSKLHLYEVGELYSRTRTNWPEAVDYNYREGTHEIRIFLPSPSAGEVAGIQSGKCEFGLFLSSPVIFLLYTIAGAVRWSDAPFSWWLVPDHERHMPNPEPAEQERALVQIVLVDASTGIIKAMRAVTWSPEFTAAIHKAIRDQASRPFDRTEHDRIIEATYGMFPDSADMLNVVTVRTAGGE